jgi:peroxiredoxin
VFRCFHHVAQQRNVRDRTDATGNGCNGTRNVYGAFEVNVTFEHAVDQGGSDVDYGSARHQILAPYQTGCAGRHHNDLRHAEVGLQIARFLMENRYRCVLRQHEHGYRCANDDRSADDRGTPATQRPVRASLEQQHNRRRRRRQVLRSAPKREVSLVGRMCTINVLMCRNGIGNLANREMRRQRLLEHNSMHGRIFVEVLEARANFGRRCLLDEVIDDDADSDALARSYQIADVGEARLVFAHENHGELRMNPAFAQRTRPCNEFRSQVCGEASSVEYQGGHAVGVSCVGGKGPILSADRVGMSRYVVWLIAASALIIALIVLGPFFIAQTTRAGGPAGLTGQAAPVFALRDDRGVPVSLDQYRGRVVVMNLWASWCPPCRAEMPDLQRLARSSAGRGVTIVGVNEGESAARARAFAESLGIRFPIWIDGNQQYGRTYAALGLPTTVILDRRGLVARGFDGALTFDQMQAAVAAVVQMR